MNKKLEPYFFYFLCLIITIPLLLNACFVSMDGPAHLYNAYILKDIVMGDGWYKDFFVINHELVPNWFGHLSLLALDVFFDAKWADKIFLFFCVFLLPVSFRYLLKQIAQVQLYFSYFIFIFSYTFLFVLGFYNFCFSLIFLFFTIGYYLKHFSQLKITNYIVLGILFILCYFSHLFSFISVIIFISYHNFFNIIKGQEIKLFIADFIKKQSLILLSSAIPLYLTAMYFIKRAGTVKNNTFLTKNELVNNLLDIRVTMAYSQTEEWANLKMISILFFSFLFIGLYNFAKNIELSKEYINDLLFNKLNPWIMFLFTFIFLYFYMPDSDGYAGFVNIRLALIIYFTLIIIFSQLNLSKNYVVFSTIIIVFFSFKQIQEKHKVQNSLNELVPQLTTIENNLPPNSVVYPINVSGNWITPHISNLLGIRKPVLILENYEAFNDYFPIKWNYERMHKWTIGGKDVNLLFNSQSQSTKEVEYLLLYGTMEGFKGHPLYGDVMNFYYPATTLKDFILFKKKSA